MTPKRLLVLTFTQLIIFIILKVWFFKFFQIDNVNLLFLYYWIATAVLAAAICRRFGHINYLEAIFVGFLWVILDIIFDFLITSLFVGVEIFAYWQFWVDYFFMAFFVLLFHKKRHVEIREQMSAAHKAHGHGGHH